MRIFLHEETAPCRGDQRRRGKAASVFALRANPRAARRAARGPAFGWDGCGLTAHRRQSLLGLGRYGIIRPANSGMEMVCSHTLPGPCSTVRNSPSPPKSTFLKPRTISTL